MAGRLTWRLALAVELTALLVVGSITVNARDHLGVAFGICFVLTAWVSAGAVRRADAIAVAAAAPATMLVAVVVLFVFTGADLTANYTGWRMMPVALGQQLWALITGTAGAVGCALLRQIGSARVAAEARRLWRG